MLDTILEEKDLKSHPELIYNMDESGLLLNPRLPMVVVFRGQKKVCYQYSGSKIQITILGCCNRTGQVIPPFVIFHAKQINHLSTRGEVSGTRYGLSDSEWTDQALFYGWLEEYFCVMLYLVVHYYFWWMATVLTSNQILHALLMTTQ